VSKKKSTRKTCCGHEGKPNQLRNEQHRDKPEKKRWAKTQLEKKKEPGISLATESGDFKSGTASLTTLKILSENSNDNCREKGSQVGSIKRQYSVRQGRPCARGDATEAFVKARAEVKARSSEGVKRKD